MKRYLPVMAGLLLIIGPVVASTVISAAIGDPVHLTGFAPGSDAVYLFLTGPNLPGNGVRLDDISAPVISGDSSSFTRASVDNDRWEYSWYTRTKGGTPDAGTYTIFIVTTPVGRRDLAGAPYATIMVSLGSPGLYILPSGGVTILSSPRGDDMVLDGIPPVTIPMERQNHTGDMTNEGYISPNITMVVPGEDTITVERSSEPADNQGTIHPVMTPPQKIPIPIPVIITAIGCVPGVIWLRKKTEW